MKLGVKEDLVVTGNLYFNGSQIEVMGNCAIDNNGNSGSI